MSPFYINMEQHFYVDPHGFYVVYFYVCIPSFMYVYIALTRCYYQRLLSNVN